MKTFLRSFNEIGHIIGIPHYWYHAFVAVVIQLLFTLVTGPAFAYGAAMFFYVGRELRDYEKIGKLDKKGLIYPVVATTLTFLFYIAI